MEVLLIDPWGVNNTAEYLQGLIKGISDLTDLTVITNYYSNCTSNKATILKLFFKISEKMNSVYVRKIIRGLEYIKTYLKIMKITNKRKFDIIHINWLLFYKVDILFLRSLKKKCAKIIYTAHNVIPHIDGNKKTSELQKIYDIVDEIIVHGEAIKSEMVNIFPKVEDKIHIQKHGAIITSIGKISFAKFPEPLMHKIKKYNKIFLMCGAIYYNKGTDRLLKIWIQNYLNQDALLIIAGEQTASYEKFETLALNIKKEDNVEIINKYIDEEMMNALFSISTVILIPYVHASMSGTVFSAASFRKPVLCTNVGALPEYIEPDIDSFLCDNTYDGIKNEMDKLLYMNIDILKQIGSKFYENITDKCNWDKIGNFIVKNVYKSL